MFTSSSTKPTLSYSILSLIHMIASYVFRLLLSECVCEERVNTDGRHERMQTKF